MKQLDKDKTRQNNNLRLPLVYTNIIFAGYNCKTTYVEFKVDDEVYPSCFRHPAPSVNNTKLIASSSLERESSDPPTNKMPSKRMNTYFKDKLLVFNSVLAIIFALVGLLGDYWWEMNVTSSSTVDLGLWTQVTCGQTLFGAGNFSTYACFKDDNDNNGIVFVYVYRQCLSKTKK